MHCSRTRLPSLQLPGSTATLFPAIPTDPILATMSDTAVDASVEKTTRDLKAKEPVEETKNGKDKPANGKAENEENGEDGADNEEEEEVDEEDEEDEGEGDEDEGDEDDEVDGTAGKRAAEDDDEEDDVDVKKQKTDDDD